MQCCGDIDKNNKGFSLVELIVVIAIMAVLVGAVTIAAIPSKDARECMEKLEGSLFKGRLDSMGKRNYSFVLTRDSSGIYLETYDSSSGAAALVSSERIGKASVAIGYVNGSGSLSDAVVLADGAGVTIAYDRASGAFRDDIDLSYLTFTRGSRTYVLRFYKETGKIEEQ